MSHSSNDSAAHQATTARVISQCNEMHRLVMDVRRQGKSIALVPTMGALHGGHLSLVEAAARECDFIVVSIFVNPTQFSVGEDYQQYPRTLAADLRALAPYPIHCVFTPSETQLYPPGHSTYVDPPEVARVLEGKYRPGHFRGVVTVVLKLLHLVPADVAYFGHKDYQQSLVIRRMVEDLNVPVTIRVCPTVRDPDGLALSSRNAYLTPDQREQARALSRSLSRAADLVEQGQCEAKVIAAQMHHELSAAGVHKIDYVALVHPETLADVSRVDQPTIAAVAAVVGSTRLIDNRLIG